jgi:hypothetical protein
MGEEPVAPIRFQKFLNRYGIKALVVGTPDIVPGSIIERRNRGFFNYGHLKNILGGSQQSWDVVLQTANLVYGTVERTLSLSGRASLNEFGVTIGGGLGRVNSVKFEIKEVRARTFVHRDKLSLIQEIFDYRKQNRRKWNRFLNDKWVADYTYYATRFVFYFDTATGVDIRADTKDKISVASAGGSFKWGSKGRLVVTTTDEVPFGFSGWKL